MTRGGPAQRRRRARTASRAPSLLGPVPGRRVRGAAARAPARVRARAALRRGVGLQGRPRAGVVRAARRRRRAAVLDVARRLRRARPAPRARRRRAGRRRRRLRLLPRLAHRPRRSSRSRSPGCGSPARATCSPSSSGCAHAARRGPVRAAEARCRARRSRARSASSPARAARRATTCSPACAAAAGAGGSCGRSRRCRTATPRRAITRALQDLAACAEVDVIVVARGGGSLADLFALLRRDAVPHRRDAARAGHRVGRPPHRPHAARRRRRGDVLDADARRRGRRRRRLRGRPRALSAPAARLEARARRAIVDRARTLARLSRAPAQHVARHRDAPAPAAPRAARGSARAVARGRARQPPPRRRARAQRAAVGRARARRSSTRSPLALAAHDPQRTLERGYALVEVPDGRRRHDRRRGRARAGLTLRMRDGVVRVRPDGDVARTPR